MGPKRLARMLAPPPSLHQKAPMKIEKYVQAFISNIVIRILKSGHWQKVLLKRPGDS
jgi:hypothetical protein